jgi:hypothetical protein
MTGAVSLGAAGLLAPQALGQAASANTIFTMGNYPVEASANDAVAAKSRAIADGQRFAFRSLVKRLVPVTAYGRLRRITAAANPAVLVESVSVRSERNSSTEYIANLDFRFQPDAVRALLDREGIPYADRQAPPITLVPIWRAPADAATAPATFSAARGPKAWTDAWRGLDLTHALTPVKLDAAKPEIAADTLKALAAGNPAQWRTFAANYPAAGDRLIAAIAEPDVAKRRLDVTLIGYDATGAINWRRAYRVDAADAGYAIELAAVVSLGVLEGRWKVMTIRGTVAASSNAPAANLPWSPAATPAGTGDNAPFIPAGPATAGSGFQLAVEFRGMAEWQDISRRLAATPGVDAVDVLGLSGRSARVTLRYPAGADQLASAIASQGLQLRQGPSGWVLSLP